MQNNLLNIIINDVDKVQYVINEIHDCFMSIALKYDKNIPHNAVSYYLTGHSASFINILLNVFDGNIEIYENNGDFLVKIKDNFYDIRGWQNPKNLEDYIPCTLEEFRVLEFCFRSNSIVEKSIEKDLILVGKKALENLMISLQNNNKVTLSKTK